MIIHTNLQCIQAEPKGSLYGCTLSASHCEAVDGAFSETSLCLGPRILKSLRMMKSILDFEC